MSERDSFVCADFSPVAEANPARAPTRSIPATDSSANAVAFVLQRAKVDQRRTVALTSLTLCRLSERCRWLKNKEKDLSSRLMHFDLSCSSAAVSDGEQTCEQWQLPRFSVHVRQVVEVAVHFLVNVLKILFLRRPPTGQTRRWQHHLTANFLPSQ